MGLFGFLTGKNKKKKEDPELKRRIYEYLRNMALIEHRQVFLEHMTAELQLPLYRIHLVLEDLKKEGRIEDFYVWKCDQCDEYKTEEFTKEQAEKMVGEPRMCSKGHFNQVSLDSSFYVGYKFRSR